MGNLEELGERFAEVLTDCAFPRASKLRIVTKQHQLEGFVEDCKRHWELGFFTTVRLSSTSRWSEQWFTPMHLLRLWSGTGSGKAPKVYPLRAASGH